MSWNVLLDTCCHEYKAAPAHVWFPALTAPGFYGSTWSECTLTGSNRSEWDPCWAPPIPPTDNLQPLPARPTPQRAEGRDRCSATALQRSERGAELLSVRKDFSYVSIRLQWAHIGTKYSPINVTSTGHAQLTLAAPPPGCCVWTNHKGQGPVPRDPLFPFEVYSPNLGDNLLWVGNANYKQQGV